MNVMTHPNASSSSSLRAVTPTEKQRPRGKDRRNPEADEEPALTVGGEPEHHGEQEREAGCNEEEGLRGAERSDFVVRRSERGVGLTREMRTRTHLDSPWSKLLASNLYEIDLLSI